MKTSFTMIYPAAPPVLRVRVEETTPTNRPLLSRVTFGLFALVSLAACVGAFSWSDDAEIRVLAVRPQSSAPIPALTADQWMTCFAWR